MLTDDQAYERDAYLREISSSIVVSGEEDGRPFVVLDDTVLYPEGGGQPCDWGTIADVRVREVVKAGGEIRHYVPSAPAGPSVAVRLDWARRYDHMQQHTAQHLLSALFLDRFNWPTKSFHLGAARCDIELETPSVESESLGTVERAFMEAVRAALPVRSRRVSVAEYAGMDLRGRGLPPGHRGTVRLVEIEGVDTTTCGGTHLRSTAEIESVQLGPVERMRGGCRLYWIAGGRVRRRLGELEGRLGELRALFETSEEDLAASARSRLAALDEANRAVRSLEEGLANAHAAALAATEEGVIEAHFDGFDGDFLARVGRALVGQVESKAVLLTASHDDRHLFLVAVGAHSGVRLSRTGPEIAELLGGRGGGSSSFFQGRAASLEGRARALELLRSAAHD